MVYKVFLDINIIIDFFQKTRALHQEARQLFLNIADGKISGYFSESVINTTAYILRNDLTKDQLIYQLDVLNSQLILLPCSNLTIHNAYKRAKKNYRRFISAANSLS